MILSVPVSAMAHRNEIPAGQVQDLPGGNFEIK